MKACRSFTDSIKDGHGTVASSVVNKLSVTSGKPMSISWIILLP